MPNGGSDCCGTCWFNAKNKGERGHQHARDPEPAYCTIRGLPIEGPFWTYCANHPHRFPERMPIPVGPVYVARRGFPYGREVLELSPDSEEIRANLLNLVKAIPEQPKPEYPASPYADHVVIWQLGEFREAGAEADLRRILAFNPEAASPEPFRRTRARTIELAREALEKITMGGPTAIANEA